MTVTYRDGVAILKVCVYSPYLLASIYVVYKHGLSRNSGWILLVVFCLLRLMGSSAQLATINESNPKTAYTVAAVTDGIGSSLLLLTSLGLISRAYHAVLRPGASAALSFILLMVPRLLVTAGLILCIVAATTANEPTDIEGEITLKVGIILYLVTWVVLLFLVLLVAARSRHTEHSEPKLILAVAIALPFILARIIYSAIGTFGGSSAPRFNIVSGNVTVYLVMTVLEEIVVVAIYTITGLKTAKVAWLDQPTQARPNMTFKASRGGFKPRKYGLIGLATSAVNAVNDHRSTAKTPLPQEYGPNETV